MNYLKINLITVILLGTFVSACNDHTVSINRIEYSIPEHISIKADDFKTSLGDIKTDPSSSIYIVVVLYSYSSGVEKISFSGAEDVKTSSAKGKLKALFKVMEGDNILRAEFAKGEGSSKEEMITSLVKEIKLKLLM